MKLLNILIAALFACVSSLASAFTIQPVDGLWGIVDESNLAIGRAFNIEVTDAVLVMTMYAYNNMRAPTFYIAAGLLDSNNRFSATMNEPQGGTCLGCAPTSGRLLSTLGTVSFEFTSSTTGYVTLPGEGRMAIVKGAIAWPAAPAGLLGLWVFNYIASTGGFVFSDAVPLDTIRTATANGSGVVSDTSFTTGCEYQTSGASAGQVFCVRYLGSSATVDKLVRIKWYGNLMDGSWYYGRDLPTLNFFTARRLVSNSGNLASIKRAAEPLDVTERMNAFRDAMHAYEALKP